MQPKKRAQIQRTVKDAEALRMRLMPSVHTLMVSIVVQADQVLSINQCDTDSQST